MNNTFLKSILIHAALVFALGLPARMTGAEYSVVRDAFTLNGTTRGGGAPLGGLAPEQGAGAWKSAPALEAVFAGGGAVTNTTSASGARQSAEARIAIPAFTAATTVSVDFTTGPGSNLDWLAIGFTASDTAGGWITAGNANRALLWVLIRPSGKYAVYAHGTQTLLKTSGDTIAGFATGGHTLSLSYDPDTGRAGVSLSAFGGSPTELYSGDVSSHLGGAPIKAAGFRLHMPGNPAAAGTALIDRFQISQAVETTLVRDSFALSPPSRVAGASLGGLSPERGTGAWIVTGSEAVFASSGAITNTLLPSGNASGAEARIPVPPPAASITVSADFVTGPHVGWVSVGFCNSGGGDWLSHAGANRALLWVLIRPSGKYAVYANGTRTLLAKSDDAIAGFSTGTHRLSLAYDPVTGTAGAFLVSPGREPMELYTGDVSGHFGADAIVAAGFRVHVDGALQTAGTVSVDNFRVGTGNAPYQIFDYGGSLVAEGKASLGADGLAAMPFVSPGGFHEVVLGGETTGYWRPWAGEQADGFLSIDTAMSWLTAPEDRPQLIDDLRLVTGTGGLARERLSWRAINPADGQWDWEADRFYDATRRFYAESGVKVLEMFHNAPLWMGRAQNNPFPDDLVGAARSWGEVARRWSHMWGGLEVWNEPNIGFGGHQPADQYVPLLKTFRRAMADAGADVPLGGGVFAAFNYPYLDLAARNGLIDECDFVSFHYYSDALGLENHVERYRAWLAGFGRETKPLWVTELGAAFRNVADTRPSPDVQAASALGHAMKAVEAKACGIARAFPFLYTYYAERETAGQGRHFGMMDHRNTPLRMLAASAQAGRMLAGMDYIGDVPAGQMPGAQRVRVFAPSSGSGDALVAVYTGKVSKTATVQLPFAATSARGVDGRALPLSDAGRRAPAPDGLTYVRVPRVALAGVLDTQTTAMRLWNLGRAAPPPVPAPAGVVLQPRIDASAMWAISTRGYYLREGAAAVDVNLGVVNLTPAARTVTLRAPGAADVPVAVPPLTRRVVPFSIPLAALPRGMGEDDLRVEFTATADNGSRIAPVSLTVTPNPGNRSLAEHLAESSYQYALPIGDASRWRRNASGSLTFGHTPPALWGYSVIFPAGVDRWAYPYFLPPEEVDMNRVTGVLVRARCLRPATVRLMTWDADENRSNNVTHFPIIPADGEWHVVYVSLASFHQAYASGERPRFARLSVGFNSLANENTLEISDIYLIGKGP